MEIKNILDMHILVINITSERQMAISRFDLKLFSSEVGFTYLS
jgi:hypothetical protein